MKPESSELARQKALARSAMYRLLARSFTYPRKEIFDFVQSPHYEESLTEYLSLHSKSHELVESLYTFRVIYSSWRGTQSREDFEQEYTRLFAHLGPAKCPPYETEYGHDNVFQKTEAMADIAGFYNAYGLEVSSLNADRVDFIGMELEFMSYLAMHEAYAIEHEENEHLAICVDSQHKFLRDHLGRWVTVFSQMLAHSTGNSFYRQLAIFTGQFLDYEAGKIGVALNKVSAPNDTTLESPAPLGCDGCSVSH